MHRGRRTSVVSPVTVPPLQVREHRLGEMNELLPPLGSEVPRSQGKRTVSGIPTPCRLSSVTSSPSLPLLSLMALYLGL